MVNYQSELNFVLQFNLSRNGMIQEIKKEFDIIRMILGNRVNLNNDEDMIDRIVVMTLRKLLLENAHDSVLLNVCPDFKMPVLDGRTCNLGDKLVTVFPPYVCNDISTWISIDDWKNQNIAYYDKNVHDLPEAISVDTFQCILNRLKGNDKNVFNNLFHKETTVFESETMDVYLRNNPLDISANQTIFDLMKKAGYYSLTIYDFIKHISDKRGAHIDLGIAPLVKITNHSAAGGITPIQNFSLMLIYAAKKQIPELTDYWPEMVELP